MTVPASGTVGVFWVHSMTSGGPRRECVSDGTNWRDLETDRVIRWNCAKDEYEFFNEARFPELARDNSSSD